jgi:chorismate synthase
VSLFPSVYCLYLGRVAAGAIAEKWLHQAYGIEIVAFVYSVGETRMSEPSVSLLGSVTREQVDRYPVRCPDHSSAEKMIHTILEVKNRQDSIGGTIMCVCRNVPAGWGEPCFDKLEARLAHAMLSLPATKGFEIGTGFAGTCMLGSTHNDAFCVKPSNPLHDVPSSWVLGTQTNHSGGVQGGISNGEPIVFRVAFKPPATIGKSQLTVGYDGSAQLLTAHGRHDPCVLPRAVPIVEAMAALVLIDACFAQLARKHSSSIYPQFSGHPIIGELLGPATSSNPDSFPSLSSDRQ